MSLSLRLNLMRTQPTGNTMSAVKMLGKYYLLEPVSTTAASSRWRALEIGPEGPARPVLLDRLGEALARDEARRHELERRIQQLRSLEHPALVSIVELAHVRDEWILVRDAVPGCSGRALLARLRQVRSTLTIDQGLFFALELLRGLEAIERFGREQGQTVAHGHVHPGNVLVGWDGRVQLAAFGIAHLLEAPPHEGLDTEALPYRSPEHVRRLPLDGRSDLFSVGALLVELLTGEPAFQGRTNEDTAERIGAGLGARALVDRGLDPALAEFLAKALTPVTEHRFTSAAEAWAAIAVLAPMLDPAVAQRSLADRLHGLFAAEMAHEQAQLQEATAGLARLLANEPEAEEEKAAAAQVSPSEKKTEAARAGEVARQAAMVQDPPSEPLLVSPTAKLAELLADQDPSARSAVPASTERDPAAEPRPAPAAPEADAWGAAAKGGSRPEPAPRADAWASAAKSSGPASFHPSGRQTDEPPSGLIPHDQMHAMLTDISKANPWLGGASKIPVPPSLKPSGRQTDEPPSGLIPHDQMHAMLADISKAAPWKAGSSRMPAPPSVRLSGKQPDEPPSGLIPHDQMHAMVPPQRPGESPRPAAAPGSEGPAARERPATRPISLGTRPKTEPRVPVVRSAAEKPVPEKPKAKSGCFGMLALVLLALGALAALL
jgi:serine/threonine protein kinase